MTDFYNPHKHWWAVKDGVFPLHTKLPYSIYFLHLFNNTKKSLQIIKKNKFRWNSTVFFDFFFKYFNEITSVKMCMYVRSLPSIVVFQLYLYIKKCWKHCRKGARFLLFKSFILFIALLKSTNTQTQIQAYTLDLVKNFRRSEFERPSRLFLES